MALSAKQQRFVEQYLIDCNATQAAIRAGYSPKTAQPASSRLLSNVMVQTAIKAKQAELSERAAVSAERIIREYARIAFVDPRSIFTWGPDGVRIHDSASLGEDDAVCLAEIVEAQGEYGRNIRIKLCDKIRALDALSKHLGLFERDNKQYGPVEFRVIIDDDTVSAEETKLLENMNTRP